MHVCWQALAAGAGAGATQGGDGADQEHANVHVHRQAGATGTCAHARSDVIGVCVDSHRFTEAKSISAFGHKSYRN